MTDNKTWVPACDADAIDDEDVLRFDHANKSYAIYKLDGEYFATDGYCTHEQQHLGDGLVMDGIIECPLHMGQFDIETGEALAGPVCVNLNTYDTKNQSGKIYLNI